MTEPRCVIHFNLIKSMVLTDITEAKVDELLQIFPKWADSDEGFKNPVARIAWRVVTNLSISSKCDCHASSCYLRISNESKLTRALSSCWKRQVITVM